MSIPSSTNSEVELRRAVNRILEWVFFHLVKEVRALGIPQTPRELPVATKSALIQAELGAVMEIRSELRDIRWAEEWETNAKVWTLQMVLGDDDLDQARRELERAALRGTDSSPPFALCGILAARHLNQSLNQGMAAEQWLERYDGTFAATARLFNSAA